MTAQQAAKYYKGANVYVIPTKTLAQGYSALTMLDLSSGDVDVIMNEIQEVINNVTNYPIIRPVACFDKLEIIDIAKKIDTYETSILPYEDCCTIFLPKHPVINPKLDKAILYENSFDYRSLINKCVKDMGTIKIDRDYNMFNI